MKKVILAVLAVICILISVGCASDKSLDEYTIYLHPDASAWERKAAYELEDRVKEAFDYELKIVLSEDKRTECEIFIGKESLPEEVRGLFDYSAMGHNGFAILTHGDDYYISSVTDTGLSSAIGYFVENVISDLTLKKDFYYITESEYASQADMSKKLNVSIGNDTGTDVYKVHQELPSGYRYGPSMIVNEDGSIDMWLAGGGSGIEQWDWIVYMHSEDGVEWSEEKCVLQPTPGALDHYSCCDPGVIYLNGYYYLGYTSTSNENQCENNLFVARSKNPDGPFEKWNGSGWGGNDPKPIVYFAEEGSLWGAGEASFVELDGTLYIYYTMSGVEGHTTRVAVADATDENWPLTMEYKGIALGAGTNDAIDVKYVDQYKKFIAVASEARLSEDSYLMFYESNDGLTFTPVDAVKENVYYFCHNPGISGDSRGHITSGTKTYVAYAYGKGWGIWNARIQEIGITIGETTDFDEINGLNIRKPIQRDERDKNLLKPVGISTGNKCVMRFPSTQTRIIPTIVYCDVTHSTWKNLNAYKNQVKVYGYDESIIKLADASVISFDVVGVGETMVTFEYDGHITQLLIVIYEREGARNIQSIEPMAYDTITVVGDIKPQIKIVATYGDGSWEVVRSGLSYEYDTSVLEIDENGIVTLKKPGEHNVTIKLEDKTTELTIKCG